MAELRSAVSAALSDPEDAGAVAMLCDACGPLLAVDGASITASAGAAARDTLYASDAVIAHLEQLEYSLGEGPGQQAYATGRPVLAADLVADSAAGWPVLGSSLTGSPIAAVFAFPLQYGSARVGTLMLYRSTPGGLSSAQLTSALQVVDLATMLLIGRPEEPGGPAYHGRLAASLAMSLPQARARVHQATGIMMAEFTIPADQALARLRGYAFATGRLIEEVAGDMVETRLHPRDLAG